MITKNSKSVYVIKIFLGQSGFNAVMKTNVEALTGTICSVQVLILKRWKIYKISILPVICAKEKICKMKVEVAKLEKEINKMKVENDMFQ